MEAIIISVILLGTLWWWLRRKHRPFSRLGVPSRRKRVVTSNAVPAHLMRELNRLTRDRRVSERLIQRIEFNNPGRSKRWCIEKAIYDIQRDRRS